MSRGETVANRPIVVLDSNVIISGLAFESGNPAEVLDLLWQGRIQAYISPFIFEEVRRALLGSKFGWDKTHVNEVIAFLEIQCSVVDTPPTLSIVELSPEDSRVLDCAIQGQVQYVITGDRRFQRLREYQGILVVSPGDFMTIIGSEF